MAALNGGDTKAASSVYAGGARLLAPSADLIRGREAIEAFWRAGVDAGISDVEFDVFEVQRKDVLAYEIGRYSLRLRPATGEMVIDRGRYVLVHERQPDGSWCRAVEMFTADGPPTTRGPSFRRAVRR